MYVCFVPVCVFVEYIYIIFWRRLQTVMEGKNESKNREINVIVECKS